MKNISVIGVGKLGLCFSLTLEKSGYNVVGVDVSEDYVCKLNDKKIETSEPGVKTMLSTCSNFVATTNLEDAVNHSDILFVVVATPSYDSGRYDHRQVDVLCDKLSELGRQETQKHLIVCCTTMPGYCDQVAERMRDFNYTVSYNPEFIAQGTILRDQSKPDMVLIGEDNTEVGDIIEKIYHTHTDNEPTICRMTRTEAEITKISLNCFCTTKISFANMIGDIVKKSGGRPEVVLNAIGSDSRVNHKYLKYGFGYGGPCFPRDNRALSIYAGDIDCPAKISVATDETNQLHLEEQIKQIQETKSDGSEILVDGVAYKKGTTILEESQQLKYAIKLSDLGYIVTIQDIEDVLLILKEQYGSKFKYEVIK